MNELLVIMLGIMAFFFLFLVVKVLLRKDEGFCSICLAVSGMWIILLVLSWLGFWKNKIILALLIGQSITGLFYLVEKKVRRKWTLFRLPFLLTLLTAGYALIESEGNVAALIFLALLWLLFLFAYAYRTNHTLHGLVNKIIECCKRW